MGRTTMNPGAGDAGARDRLREGLDGPENSPNRHTLQASASPAARRRDPHFEHHIRRCHALGPRPLAELLGEIADATGCPEIVAQRLAAYARLSPDIVRLVGGTEFPPLPMEAVR